MAKTRTTSPEPLARMRASVTRMQSQGEQIVGRLRREAAALVTRSRTQATKELRELERRVLKGLHAATEERVTRLERRITKLEETVAELRKVTPEDAA